MGQSDDVTKRSLTDSGRARQQILKALFKFVPESCSLLRTSLKGRIVSLD